jgi:hypothetical protein
VFELLGIAAVCFVVWKLLKGFGAAAVRAHMLKSVSHAMSQGVPHSFARQMIVDRETMALALAFLAKEDPNSRANDAYVQNGNAITLIYRGFLRDQQKEKHV